MSQKLCFNVQKETNTYADALLAVGTADLLNEIYGDEARTSIKDKGDSFEIEVSSPEGLEHLDRYTRLDIGYPFVKQKEDEKIPSGVENIFDYPKNKQIEDAYIKFEKTAGKKKNKIANNMVDAGLDKPPAPDPSLKLHKILASMRKGWKSDKEFCEYFINNREKVTRLAADNLKRMAGSCSERCSEDELDKIVSGSQILLPIGGKGVNRPKPDSTGKSGLPSDFIDWFSEWMKYRGMFKFLLPYRNGDDFKFFVITPKEISYNALMAIHKELFDENLWGGIKLDIRATLDLAKILIMHSKEYDKEKGSFMMLKKRPNQIIEGLSQAYFKSLGTAAALMNYSFLGLPGWFAIDDNETAHNFMKIIDEHEKCISPLQDDISSDIPLLQEYRSFLSSGDYRYFLEFLALYGPYIIQRRERNKWVMQFTVQNLRRIFMVKKDYSEIISNEGFLNLATAIRKATVSAQYRKAQGNREWDIKYGLAQDWKRVVEQPEKLIIAISDFVQQYNAENARHAEEARERRSNVTTKDLNQVLDLIKNYDSDLVGMLLLAYGYARDVKEKDETDEIKEGEIK
ncbi:MAG: hypothetical protein A4E49_00446 [Methanosaeta sp. PtaU1.Bin112]|nr:MAG: hypothetical protein A4E49_00446 [Methanosaeta sp. PtaU1.Bin112]